MTQKNKLPIGTVVLLKNSAKKLIIIGSKQVADTNEKQVYDYMGVFFPEGYISSYFCFLFNGEDINDVVFIGYINDEYRKYTEKIEEVNIKRYTGV